MFDNNDEPRNLKLLSEHKPEGFLDELSARLEAMFDDPSLSQLRQRDPTHPAVKKFVALQEIRQEQRHLLLPRHSPVLIEVLREMMDASMWGPHPPNANFWEFLEDSVRREKLPRLRTDQYEDVVAELFCWGWLRNQGFAAELVEESGRSDLVISSDQDVKVRAEVKRIHGKPGRVQSRIDDANGKIKASAPSGGGVVFISLGLPVEPALPGDEVPLRVQGYIDEAKAAIRDKNSSVGQVVITWDDFFTRDGEAPVSGRLFVRRRSEVLEHEKPAVQPSIDSEQLRVTLITEMDFRPRPGEAVNQTPEDLLNSLRASTTGEAVISAPVCVDPAMIEHGFRELEIGPAQLLKAFRHPDAAVVQAIAAGLGRSVVVTKRGVNNADGPLLVVHAYWKYSPGEWFIDGGYRLYDSSQTLDRLALDPNEAFAEVLLRYGTRFSVGLGKVWWVPDLHVQGAPGMTPTQVAMGIPAACGVRPSFARDVIHTFMATAPGGELHAGGLYWIDAEKYRATELAASRGAVRS